MNKTVVAKFSRLPNVVGRVDYISNPKRQENLLGFYQTPENPEFFWKALSEESQELAAYNKAQMEEHNNEERRKFETGEIRRKRLWKTVEARENILALPNDIFKKMDMQEVAQFLAEDIKARHGIECAVGVHLNAARTNLHAHIILPERKLLEESRESIATRNTFFNAEGKRSTKKECVDELGNLKPGCRLVKKGEQLHQRRFSEKDPVFANKGFAYNEKIRYAKLFNEWSEHTWTVYNHYKNPHMRLYNLVKGEPEGLRTWKERENKKIRLYNTVIDKLINDGEITTEQALEIKKELYFRRAEKREQRKQERLEWERWYVVVKRNKTYDKSWAEERRRILYTDYGRERTVLELIVILGLQLAGVDVFKDNSIEDGLVRPHGHIKAVHDEKLQMMIDDVYRAAGKKTPSEVAAENRIKKLANTDNRDFSVEERMAQAEAIRSEQTENLPNRPSELQK